LLEDGTRGPGGGIPFGPAALNSDVLSPADGETVVSGPVEVRGYAFGGRERHVARVDVSVQRRELVAGGAARRPRLVGLAALADHRRLAPGDHQILVRVWGSSAATQPEDDATPCGTRRAT
jgi:sulfite oxidase